MAVVSEHENYRLVAESLYYAESVAAIRDSPRGQYINQRAQ